jgi:anti-anti-sigma factor
MTLICDVCGESETRAEAPLDREVVWPLVSASGWTGSPLATGRHRCPACSARPAPADSGAAREPLHGASYEIREPGGDSLVITPLTDIDADATTALRPVLADAVRTHRQIVIDMRVAEVIDSAGLGMLVRVHQGAKQYGGTLMLATPSRYVLTVLHTMRLDGVFELADDVATALSGMRRL